jgi:hypothetical protein
MRHNTTFFLELIGSNLSWWWFFLKKIFMLKSCQEYVSQLLPAQHLTDGFFRKLIVVEIIYSISKGLRI